MAGRSLVLLAGLVLLYSACADDDVLECVEVSAECAPLYTPEFDEIFTRTLQPKCALEGGSCHSIDGARAGLVFEDADTAYDLLLGNVDGRARVVPGDISCSILIARVSTAKPGLLMPPRNRLSDAERCVLIQWVANGAQR